ncbi:MAG TPA: hypothetical protein PKZ36_02755 [Candidatus Paceibacterota bacterium]|nr:hypothetical protein [Candidatus Paceibacterota bacterium]HPT18299.1 hypothetical protein [Candidatus Paceibacterota bacterium]
MFREQREPILEKKEVIVPPEKQKIINELVNFGKKTGNELKFSDYGKEYADSLLLKEEALTGLGEREVEDLGMYLGILKSYVSGPIFTDGFHGDHNSRRVWENENIQKVSTLETEAKDYYLTNRLNQGSRIHPVMGFLSEITEIIKNPNIKEKLLNLEKEIPEEFTSKEDLYSTLSDEEKVKVVNKFSEVLRNTINLLENKLSES